MRGIGATCGTNCAGGVPKRSSAPGWRPVSLAAWRPGSLAARGPGGPAARLFDEDLGLRIEGPGCDGMHVPRDDAAYAANWRTVLAIDNAVGLVILIAGLVVGKGWGAVLVIAAGVYLFFSVGRVVKWRRLRRQAGL